jgi:hypothetical protein
MLNSWLIQLLSNYQINPNTNLPFFWAKMHPVNSTRNVAKMITSIVVGVIQMNFLFCNLCSCRLRQRPWLPIHLWLDILKGRVHMTLCSRGGVSMDHIGT